MLVLFTCCWGTNLSIQAEVGKLNGDLLQLSGIKYEVWSFSVRYLISIAYWKGLISRVKMSVVVPQAIGISLRNKSLFHTIWFGTDPYLKVPSLDLLDPFLTTTFSFLLQKYCPKETTAYSPNSSISSAIEMVPSRIVIIGLVCEVLGVGICILMEGMVVECVEIIEAEGEKMEVGTYVMGLG